MIQEKKMPRPKKVSVEDLNESEVVELVEEVLVEQSIEEPAEEVVIDHVEPVELMAYKVFLNGEYICAVKDESEELVFFLEQNKAQLDLWVEELRAPITDQKLLFTINYPDVKQPYNSISHYQAQNGFAPTPPKITNLLDYHKQQKNLSFDEEVAVAVMGDLDYSFVPAKVAE
jgi:hypothetical protein